MCSEEMCRSILGKKDFDNYKRYTNAFIVDTNENMIFCPNQECF
jgi:hypothetical protein